MAEMQPPLDHEDSIDSQDPNNKNKAKKVKNRKPANTAFRQQRLKAWQPILTPKSVLPLFFAIGVVFAPIGGLLLWASSQVQEIILDYTNCATEAPVAITPTAMPDGLVTWNFKDKVSPKAFWSRQTINYTYPHGVTVQGVVQCNLVFDVPSDMGAPVLFYYRLTNFYQNHRRYVKSFDNQQLKGEALSAGTIGSGSCDPLRLDPQGKPYYPCGLIANSVFNDTFESPVVTATTFEPTGPVYLMSNRSGIAWDSDSALYGTSKYEIGSVSPPPNWRLRYPDGYTNETKIFDPSKDQAFQVWMRTAGLPTFSKLALRNDTAPLTKGRYMVRVNSNFPAEVYGGTKAILISTRTVIGGRNPFLGIAYVVVGGICIVLGAVFLVTHLIKPRKLGDHTYLSWNNDAAPTATASGSDARANAAINHNA